MVINENSTSWFTTEWMSWNKYSENMLRSIEKRILQNIKTAYRGWFVDIGPVVGRCDKIWTLSLNSDSQNTPLVLLHGFGAGVALWCLNLDSLAATRPVFAIDLLGFGRSSRPKFSHDALEAENQMVKAIEEWRKEMNLENFVLLGHSMGGFLATSYAISHPHRVKHLILADPWGFPERPAEQSVPLPLWVKVLAFTLQPFNPLWAVRAAGPFGQWLINKARPDISRKYESYVNDASLIPQYIYQCNSQRPSGEGAFHSMMQGLGWAKNPMVKRVHELHKDVPITLMYGSKSWVDNLAAEIVKEKRMSSFVQSHIIMGAGHHVYADKPETFNKHVIDACALADGDTSLRHLSLMSPEDSGLDIKADDNSQVDGTNTSSPTTTSPNT